MRGRKRPRGHEQGEAVDPGTPQRRADSRTGRPRVNADEQSAFATRREARRPSLVPGDVQGLGAFATAFVTQDVGPRVEVLLPFAADTDFAVREWAWLALRDLGVARPLVILHRDPSPTATIRCCAVLASRRCGPEASGAGTSPCSRTSHGTRRPCSTALPPRPRRTCRTPWRTGSTASAVITGVGDATVDGWLDDHGTAVHWLARRALRSLRASVASAGRRARTPRPTQRHHPTLGVETARRGRPSAAGGPIGDVRVDLARRPVDDPRTGGGSAPTADHQCGVTPGEVAAPTPRADLWTS